MERCCCLCLVSLVNSKGKSRHRKVFGGKCNAEVQKLKECLAKESFGGLENFNIDSTLCYECLLKLKDLIRLENSIKQISDKVSGYIRNLQGILSSRKRAHASQYQNLHTVSSICNFYLYM